MLLTAQMWPKTKIKTETSESLVLLPEKKRSFINYPAMKIHLAAPDILLLYFILGNMSSNPPYFLFYLFYIYF